MHPIVSTRVAPESAPAARAFTGSETVLVVEDDDRVRVLVGRMLARLGYKVLSARDPQETFAIVQASETPIELVLSDVVMPDLQGPEIVSEVQLRSPRTKALFMSGHNWNWLAQQRMLGDDDAFIQKPFTPLALAKRVREVLDGK